MKRSNIARLNIVGGTIGFLLLALVMIVPAQEMVGEENLEDSFNSSQTGKMHNMSGCDMMSSKSNDILDDGDEMVENPNLAKSTSSRGCCGNMSKANAGNAKSCTMGAEKSSGHQMKESPDKNDNM